MQIVLKLGMLTIEEIETEYGIFAKMFITSSF